MVSVTSVPAPPTQTQAEVAELTTTVEPLIVAGTTDVATAGDVVEEVASVTTQKTRRVKSKPKATTGQEAESSLAAGNLTIEITTAPADENEATTRHTETLMTENAASETTPAPASAVTTPATGVEEQLVGAIVPPAQLDQSTGQATAADAQKEDLEALLMAVTANTGTNVASVPSVVDDQENMNTEQPVSSGSNNQQDVEVAELSNVSDATDDEDSEDDQPIITFVSASAGTKRSRAVLTGSNTSIAEPPASWKRMASTSSTGRSRSDLPIGILGRRGRSLERRSVYAGLGSLRDGTSKNPARGGRSASGSVRHTQTVETDEEEELFRLIDQTLLEMSQDVNTSGVVGLPYPRNAQVTAERLLDEDDSFFAGSPLE